MWTKSPLVELNLSGNEFTGSLSPMFELPNLATLNLSDSGLGGTLPAGLWASTELINLDLSNNQFEGGIDASIGGLGSLVELDLSDNLLLEGPIPDAFLLLRPVPEGGSLTELALNGSGCFTTNLNVALEAFLTSLDMEWNAACLP